MDHGGGPKKSPKKRRKQDQWKGERPRDIFEKVQRCARATPLAKASVDCLVFACAVPQLDLLPESKQQEIQRALHLFSFGQTMPRTLLQATRRAYHFWRTQPVPKLGMDFLKTSKPTFVVELSELHRYPPALKPSRTSESIWIVDSCHSSFHLFCCAVKFKP